MSKLRIVRERRSSANQEYDQDLRGFMHDELLTGPMVYPVLSCSTDKPTIFADPNIVGLINEEFNCRIVTDDKNADTVHIVFHDQRLLAPKLQSLRLFYLGITLTALCKGTDLSIGLWEAQPFAKKLMQSTQHQPYGQGLNPVDFFDPEMVRRDALLTVQSPITKYLHQAGVEGFAADSDNERVLDSQALAATLNEAWAPVQAQTAKRKIVGE